MSDSPEAVTVRIMDGDYRVACPEGQRPELEAAALYLNARMTEIRDSGKAVGLERVAVMAALNIAYELIQYRKGMESLSAAAGRQTQAMLHKVESALNKCLEKEL